MRCGLASTCGATVIAASSMFPFGDCATAANRSASSSAMAITWSPAAIGVSTGGFSRTRPLPSRTPMIVQSS